jgi:hypothetical protein
MIFLLLPPKYSATFYWLIAAALTPIFNEGQLLGEYVGNGGKRK